MRGVEEFFFFLQNAPQVARASSGEKSNSELGQSIMIGQDENVRLSNDREKRSNVEGLRLVDQVGEEGLRDEVMPSTLFAMCGRLSRGNLVVFRSRHPHDVALSRKVYADYILENKRVRKRKSY